MLSTLLLKFSNKASEDLFKLHVVLQLMHDLGLEGVVADKLWRVPTTMSAYDAFIDEPSRIIACDFFAWLHEKTASI